MNVEQTDDKPHADCVRKGHKWKEISTVLVVNKKEVVGFYCYRCCLLRTFPKVWEESKNGK